MTGFLHRLVARGLRPPLLTVTGGAPGSYGAVARQGLAVARLDHPCHPVLHVGAFVVVPRLDQRPQIVEGQIELPGPADEAQPTEVAVLMGENPT